MDAGAVGFRSRVPLAEARIVEERFPEDEEDRTQADVRRRCHQPIAAVPAARAFNQAALPQDRQELRGVRNGEILRSGNVRNRQRLLRPDASKPQQATEPVLFLSRNLHTFVARWDQLPSPIL